MKKILDKLEKCENMIEKNIYITDLKYVIHNEYKEDIEKIINKYKSKTIGEKRAAEISKEVAKIINKRSDRTCVYRVPGDKWYGSYYNTTGRKYENYSEIETGALFIRAEKKQDYYGKERINVEISLGSLNITTLYYTKSEDKYIYEPNDWDKLRYIKVEDVPMLAQQIKELYNNSILKIEELKKEIEKQKNNINNECIRGLLNRYLYIYGDYRDKLIEE